MSDATRDSTEVTVVAAGDRVLGVLHELDGIHRELAGLVGGRSRGAWSPAELDRYHDLARAELVAHRRLVVARDRFDAARRRAATARGRPRTSS